MSVDIGFTHIALTASDLDASARFYADYANMSVVHDRVDAETGVRVIWLSDRTRPFVVVLMESAEPTPILGPFAHLGVGCGSRAAVDRLAEQARAAGVLHQAPSDYGYPVGYLAMLKDPDGHLLELSHGQEIGLTVQDAGGDNGKNSGENPGENSGG